MFFNKKVVSIFILCFTVIIWNQITHWYDDYLFDNHHASSEKELNQQVSNLNELISQRFHLVHSLATAIEAELDIDSDFGQPSKQRVHNFMSALYKSNEGIRAFSIAPNCIVSDIFPLDANTNAIGHNLLEPTDQVVFAAVNQAIETRKVTNSAPYQLRQGGLGVVARLPVFHKNELWGVVAVVIDVIPSLKTIGLLHENSRLNIALRGDSGEVFYGDPVLFSRSAMTRKVDLPNGYWEIATEYKKSFGEVKKHSSMFQMFVGAFLLLFLGATYAFYHHFKMSKSSERLLLEFGLTKGKLSSGLIDSIKPAKPTLLLPALATIAIVMACIALIYFVQSHNQQSANNTLNQNISAVINDIENQLDSNKAYLEILAVELAEKRISEEGFVSKVTQYSLDHPSLINVTLSDENFVIKHTAPYEPNKHVIGLTLSLPEPKRASRLAKNTKRTIFTKPFRVIQGDAAFEFYVPIFKNDEFIGTLGAVYSLPKLISHLVPTHIQSKYTVSVQDGLAQPLYSSGVMNRSNRDSVRAPLPSLDNYLWISLSSKQQNFAKGIQSIILILSLFIISIIFSFWLQYRESNRVWRTGKSLIESQAHFHSIVSSAPIAVIISQPQSGIILYANSRAEELLSSGEDLVKRCVTDFYADLKERALFLDLLNQESRVDNFEIKLRNDSGRFLWCSLSSKIVEFAEGEGVITSITNLTQQRNYQDQLYQKANFDDLTGLPNRSMAFERLTTAINKAKQTRDSIVLMLLDLDDFKKVNDSFGHNAGDELLKQISHRIKSVISAPDIVGRLGGDEFVIILSSPESVKNAEKLAKQVINVCSKTILLQHYEVVVGCSIGLARFPSDGIDYESLTKNADAAMYESKLSGRNSYKLYSTTMSLAIEERLTMENELRYALRRDELYIVYQPIISGFSGRVIGAEALLRWDSEKLGEVSPEQFIPLAESIGLINLFGEWVLDQACGQVKQWLKIENGPEYVSVNVSSKQLRSQAIIDDVRLALTLHQLPPSALELELTESTLIEHTKENQQTFDILHNIGVRLAVDDFGIGYSSLSYLRRFSFDTLKIDRSFISDIPHESDATQLVEAIQSMAKSLDMKIVAEGVENRHQLNFLQQNHCYAIQGFFISEPLTELKFMTFCNERLKRNHVFLSDSLDA
ncbi:EAL domain-containing protein [Parashewanella spongiae]|uniref:EAL domain-containing protein n=1 Tax=Parashewanella spongiae TaxID=342950 RepID=A0A3A6U2R1_9GAMM|nr:EAL domain-containing protein [Parashewanella spongiae]MCL1077559.1 EAL domain-containing protein [Parashewanella spongiae]RJY18299.1 EAL domain-containing protein [Parashewanella spongiae]